MRKHTKSVLIVMLILAVCASVFAPSAYAQEPVTLQGIDITVELNEHPAAYREDYQIRIVADDAAFPMPEGSVNGEYTAVVSGSDTVPFPEIKYDHQGVYTYTISQIPGSGERWTYDRSIYFLHVYIVNAEDGSGMTSVIALFKDEVGESSKCDSIVFSNVYDPIETSVTITAEKTVVMKKKGAVIDSVVPETGVFSFVLKDAEGEEIQTVQNVDGTITFDALTFDALGTYTYTITEIKHMNKEFMFDKLTIGESLMLFDKEDITVIVEVYLEDGDYAAKVSFAKAGLVKESAVFENIVSIPIVGDNSNIGVWIAVFGVSLVAVIVLLVTMRKNKKEN